MEICGAGQINLAQFYLEREVLLVYFEMFFILKERESLVQIVEK